jgi:hypothetical protein
MAGLHVAAPHVRQRNLTLTAAGACRVAACMHPSCSTPTESLAKKVSCSVLCLQQPSTAGFMQFCSALAALYHCACTRACQHPWSACTGCLLTLLCLPLLSCAGGHKERIRQGAHIYGNRSFSSVAQGEYATRRQPQAGRPARHKTPMLDRHVPPCPTPAGHPRDGGSLPEDPGVLTDAADGAEAGERQPKAGESSQTLLTVLKRESVNTST